MKYLFYVIGTPVFLGGFIDGPNFIPLVIGLILLIIAHYFDRTVQGINRTVQGINSKRASEKLLTLAELKEKGVITQDEYELKSSALKEKL